MQTKPVRVYSLGERRTGTPRQPAGKKKRTASDVFHSLLAAYRLVRAHSGLLLAASIPVLILGAAVAFYNLPILKVNQVEIVGAQTLDIDRTRTSLKLEDGNMLSIDAAMVEKTLRQQPAVKTVSVHRQWPNKVVVQISERRPAAFWQTPDGIYAVDEQGVVISESPSLGPLPAVVSEEGGVRVGSKVPQAAIGLARTLGERLPREIGARPHLFDYTAPQGLAVITDQGWRAVFGDERDTDFKLSALAAVLETAKQRKIQFQYVDLRYGERPYLRRG